MTTEYKKPLPYINSETKAYWDGAKAHEFLLRKCRACGQYHFYPRDFCPSCFSFDVEWVKSSGRGTVYSVTICHVPAAGFKDVAPYNLVLVELEEGPRMMSNIVGCPNDDIKIGMPVEVVFDDVTPEVTLPKF
ncbi:MAG: Zn-ribbon domain-containing OB-fold protein, partial [Syntrophorhabdus sp.]